jgi:hypothetical protein
VDSTNLTCVCGTTLGMNGTGGSWAYETVWNYAGYGIPADVNVGSGGGISTYYAIPWWQTNVNPAAAQGSATFRNIPDVALTGDGVDVCYTSGSSSVTNGMAGTSCAAPLWAGFCALLNQQSIASSGTTVGFINPAIYALATTTNYANCFHDITTGNNIGTNTAGLYYATNGYDLATGLGTPNGTNLINALAPLTQPFFITQPAGLNTTNGANVAFNVNALGAGPLNFQWLLNGTNLPAAGNVAGTTGGTLTITAVTTNNSGSYQLVVGNAYNAITSSVAVLNVGFVPTASVSPASLTVFAGSNAVFTATPGGSSPFGYKWKSSGTNFAGANITGTNAATLTISSAVTNYSGNYTVVVTNLFGSVTSSVASLLVVVPAAITASSVTNRTVECSKNTNNFTLTAVGTAPVGIQWSFNGTPVSGATNTSFSLTNLSVSTNIIFVTVTNLYGSVTSNAMLTVRDTLAPVITLIGASRVTNELGSAFTDPGATANDTCAGSLTVAISGTVITNAVGTNTLTYTASDVSGNTGATNRTVFIRDTTPPVISRSFTNLVVAANSNCVALMTNVTGTNFILATDLSGTLTVTQSPTNNADASGNKSYSTNRIAVRDQTPPVIALNGFNPMTNELGAAFTDPGMTASDACSGITLLRTNGTVSVNVVGTNLVTYTAVDGSSNTNTVTRIVIVRDTTPPAILRSFTNLVLAADSNCVAAMPDVTGTNFIQAADLSGVSAISQTPADNFVLSLGTNAVVITVADAFGNTTYSTNAIVVLDQTPPVMLTQPSSQTNAAGAGAGFSVAASACTPLTFQWFFHNAALPSQTNAALALSNLHAANAGNYFVVAAASGGSATSEVATLTVNLFSSAVTLAASENPSGFKAGLNFIAAVTPTNATGTIQFLTNGAAFDVATVTAGLAASTNLSTLPRGTNLVAAIYSGDESFLPATNSLAQIVTNHPPVVAPAFFTLVAGLDLNIAVADLATNWSDADGDALFIAGIDPSTNGVTVTNALPTLFYSNSNYVDDQFVCAISDGFGGTNYQLVSIAVVPQTDSTPLITTVAGQPGGLILQLNGGYGSTYILESTTDLLSGPWMPVATNTLGVTGVWQFTDPGVTNGSSRFYRLKLAQ